VDWDLVEGLPVATAARIIDDLARVPIDGSSSGHWIADAVSPGPGDARGGWRDLDPARPAHQWGETDGVELARRFTHDAQRRLIG
jgi:hypothetical protein